MKEKIIEDPSSKAKRMEKTATVHLLVNILLIAVVFALLSFKSVRFAVVHNKEATNFANAYVEMEKVTKSAANQVLGEWVDGIAVNKGN